MFDLLAGVLPETTTTLLEGDGVRRHHVRLLCPTDGEWLRRQASVNVTVPVTTLLRVDDRPGEIAGASPLPAEFAREIAARSTVWNRILTDPARGTVLNEPSRTYAPDRATRTVVNTKWQTCTAPGCTAPAQTAEFEHAVPFDHCDPARGGPTHPSNGHPMCRRCHVLKTAGIIRMERVGADEIVWSLPLGVTASVIAAPIDAGGALRCASSPPGDSCVRAASENGAASVSGEAPPVMLPGHSKTPRSLGSPGHDDSPGRGSAERGSTVQGAPEHDFPAAGGITAVTTPSQAARLAARVIARMEADEARRESMRRAAATAEDRALRHTRQEARVLGRREERLTGKLESLRIERTRLAGAQRSHEQSLQRISRDREALDHESLRLERIGESVRRREQRVAQVERAWWERTREAHLRLRAEAAEREAGEWESREEFMRLLARPGVCPHSDLDAELARMRAEESHMHGSHMLGPHGFGPHVQGMPMQEEAGAPNDAEAPACPRCEAEYAAFLMEISALSGDDIDELLREEEAALRHERERERARETKRQREAFRTAKLRELEATQIREAEAAYRKEGRRLGRERAHSEYAQALSSLCAAQCCVSARATARAADGDSDRHADGTAQAHAPGTGTAGGSRSTEQAGGAPGDSAAPVITAQQPVITEPTWRTAVTRRRRSRFSDDTPPPF